MDLISHFRYGISYYHRVKPLYEEFTGKKLEGEPAFYKSNRAYYNFLEDLIELAKKHRNVMYGR